MSTRISINRRSRVVSSNDVQPTVLFAAPGMERLAQEIVQCSTDHLIVLCEIQWSEFADKWPNIFIKNSDTIRNSDVIFLASLHHPSTLFGQISVLYHLPKYLCRSLKILLPYFPTGTMERIQIQGEIATAYSLAQMLSSIPLTRSGPPEIVILDIHALQNQFYFSPNIIVRLESTVSLLFEQIKQRTNNNEKFAIAFPDDGAHKRFSALFDETDYPFIICSKIRQENDKRITTVKEGQASGHHCIIVDDLVQSGGTIIECAQALMQHGAANVSAFVGHGIFPNDSWKKFLHSNNPKVHFDTFYVTNTYPNTEVLINQPPFKVLSIANLLTKICFN